MLVKLQPLGILQNTSEPDLALNNKWPYIVCCSVMVLLLQWDFKDHKERKTRCFKIVCLGNSFLKQFSFEDALLIPVMEEQGEPSGLSTTHEGGRWGHEMLYLTC